VVSAATSRLTAPTGGCSRSASLKHASMYTCDCGWMVARVGWRVEWVGWKGQETRVRTGQGSAAYAARNGATVQHIKF
jgi:hypothetical protein